MITPQQFDDIIDAISTTADGLKTICAEHGTSAKEFYRHISKNDADCHRYACAKEKQADVIFDHMRDVARDGSGDFVVDADGVEKFQHEHVQRSKLIVETDKWTLAKLKPKKYGEKLEIEQTNFDGGKRDLTIGAPDESDSTSEAV